MKNFITFMFVAFLFLAISCGDKEEKVCDTEDAVADVSNARQGIQGLSGSLCQEGY